MANSIWFVVAHAGQRQNQFGLWLTRFGLRLTQFGLRLTEFVFWLKNAGLRGPRKREMELSSLF